MRTFVFEEGGLNEGLVVKKGQRGLKVWLGNYTACRDDSPARSKYVRLNERNPPTVFQVDGDLVVWDCSVKSIISQEKRKHPTLAAPYDSDSEDRVLILVRTRAVRGLVDGEICPEGLDKVLNIVQTGLSAVARATESGWVKAVERLMVLEPGQTLRVRQTDDVTYVILYEGQGEFKIKEIG